MMAKPECRPPDDAEIGAILLAYGQKPWSEAERRRVLVQAHMHDVGRTGVNEPKRSPFHPLVLELCRVMVRVGPGSAHETELGHMAHALGKVMVEHAVRLKRERERADRQAWDQAVGAV